MRLKLLFIVGLGIGYVLGARAGRPRYEQIKAKVTEAWEDPRVHRVVTETQDFVKDNAPIVQEKLVEGTKAAIVVAQQSAVRTGEIARGVSDKVAGAAKDVSEKVATTSKDVSRKTKKASKKVAKVAKDASENVAKVAKEASSNASKTAKGVRDRILDRGEEVVDGVIIAAGEAREGLLASDPDDDEN